MKQISPELPLLSIVIPTRNRIPYAISAIQSILEISDPRLELVVQDNSDSNDLEFWIKTNNCDLRLKYQHSTHSLSFVDNFNEAVKISNGEYICIIGDDDGVNPEILIATEYLKREGIDCLSVKTVANYVWPDSGVPSTLFSKETGGYLTLSNFKGGMEYANINYELEAFVKEGGANYLNFNLPKLYHGIVRRQSLEHIKKITGVYFGGLSPDIYIAIALACVTNRVVITDYPLTLPGVCGVSASIVEGLLKKNSKKLDDAPHLRDRGNYNWCEFVPRIYTVETIWADSSISALRAMGRGDLVRKFNLPKLAAYTVHANKGTFYQVLNELYIGLKVMKKYKVISTIRFGCKLFHLQANSILKFIKKVYNRILMIFGLKRVIKICDLKNMEEASKALTHFLSRNGHTYTDYMN